MAVSPRFLTVCAMPLAVIAVRPFAPNHNAGRSGPPMTRPLPQVPVQGELGLGAHRARPLPTAPTNNERHRWPQLEVQVGKRQPGELCQPHPRVDEQAQDRRFSPVDEPFAITRPQQRTALGLGKHRHRLLGHGRRP
jgi:hypothetical protein